MESKFEKTALVTGGASGIGAATVDELARRGWRVAVADLNLDSAASRASTYSDRAMALGLDVRDPLSAAAACESVMQRWGRLDLLVNNAGVAKHSALETFPLDDWKFILDTNLTGTLVCMQAAGRYMLAAGSGSIVNTASVAGVRGAAGRAAYAAAKAAVISLTRCAGVEWADRGVRVNAIAPGYTDTPLLRQLVDDGSFDIEPVLNRTPMRRLALPEEIARVTAFLGSEDSSYVTAQTIFVDGGFIADYGIPSSQVRKAQ